MAHCTKHEAYDGTIWDVVLICDNPECEYHNPQPVKMDAADYLSQAADELEAQANERDDMNLPKNMNEHHAMTRQMRIDARWLRAKAVALRMDATKD